MKTIDWDAMAAPWLEAEAGLEMAHQAVLDGLMRRAGLAAGDRVLDIGCGTGASLLAAATAVGEDGRVTGVDISPRLVERARERAPDTVDLHAGDAGALRHDAPFDAAISLFGTMFFADTPAAFANIRTAMKPGGRFVFAAWGAPPKNPWFGAPRAAVEAHLGPLPKPDPAAPGPFRFADASALVEALRPVGWEVAVDTQSLDLSTGQDAEGLAAMHMMLAEALMLADHDLSDADQAAITNTMRQGFGAFGNTGGVKVPAEVHFFEAVAAG